MYVVYTCTPPCIRWWFVRRPAFIQLPQKPHLLRLCTRETGSTLLTRCARGNYFGPTFWKCYCDFCTHSPIAIEFEMCSTCIPVYTLVWDWCFRHLQISEAHYYSFQRWAAFTCYMLHVHEAPEALIIIINYLSYNFLLLCWTTCTIVCM